MSAWFDCLPWWALGLTVIGAVGSGVFFWALVDTAWEALVKVFCAPQRIDELQKDVKAHRDFLKTMYDDIEKLKQKKRGRK